jgi:hypothetical protein
MGRTEGDSELPPLTPFKTPDKPQKIRTTDRDAELPPLRSGSRETRTPRSESGSKLPDSASKTFDYSL